METKQQVVQNPGVLGEAGGETEVINGETVRPDTYGRTEGGMPSGTPPSAPPAGAEARGTQVVGENEEEVDQ